MTLKQIKQLIIDKLQTAFPKIKIDVRDVSNLFTAPTGRIVVMYVGGSLSLNPDNSLSYDCMDSFEISVLTRDPLANEDVIDSIETIRETLHGLKVNKNDYERLFFQDTRFEEFVAETNVYAYKMTFQVKRDKNVIGANI